MGSYIELPKSLQRQGLINIKNEDNYCFIWSYIRYINPLNKNPNRINKLVARTDYGIFITSHYAAWWDFSMDHLQRPQDFAI